MVNNYFQNLPNQEEKINEEYNVAQKEVEEMVEMLKDWINLQPHLPKEKGEIFETRLKCLLRCNKMSIEKTKSKMDMYYSMKNFFPEFFDNKEPLQPRIIQIMKTAVATPLRKPLDHTTRVHMFKLMDLDSNKWNLEDVLSLSIDTMELSSRYDHCTNAIYVQDLKGWSLSHNLVTSPFTVAKAFKIFEKSFSTRIIAMHYLNIPAYAVTVLNKFKSLMKSKMIERLHCHEKLEDLYKFIPREILPSEYGGDDISMYEMHDEYIKFMQSHNDWFLELSKLKSNEKLRTGKLIDNELFGVTGSFRKLDID